MLWSPLRALWSLTPCHLPFSSLLPHHIFLSVSERHWLSLCHSLPLVFCSLNAMPYLNLIHTQAFKNHLHFYACTSVGRLSCVLLILSAISTCTFSFLNPKTAKSTSISLCGECFLPMTPTTTFPSIRLASEEKRRIMYLIPSSPFAVHLSPQILFLFLSHTKFKLFLSLHLLQPLLPAPAIVLSNTISTAFHLISQLMNICCSYYLYNLQHKPPTPELGICCSSCMTWGNLVQQLLSVVNIYPHLF